MSRWKEPHERELAAFNRRNDLGAVRDAATFEWTLPDPEPAAPYDVLFVLPLLGIYGGVADVLELANALVLQGVRAGVVVFETVPPEIEMELFFRPLRLSAAEFLERCPPAKLLVATGYQTAAHVAAAAASRGIQTAYFVQDYEGWFGFDSPEYVARTYDLIPRIVTISTWIAREIETRHGHVATPIPISADPDVYYPRGDRPPTPPVRITAMLRQDERRGMKFLLPALAEVASRPDVDIVLFGHAARAGGRAPLPARAPRHAAARRGAEAPLDGARRGRPVALPGLRPHRARGHGERGRVRPDGLRRRRRSTRSTASTRSSCPRGTRRRSRRASGACSTTRRSASASPRRASRRRAASRGSSRRRVSARSWTTSLPRGRCRPASAPRSSSSPSSTARARPSWPSATSSGRR